MNDSNELVTLCLHGLPSQTTTARLLRVEENCAVTVNYFEDGENKYSLTTGKRMDCTWDFWRLSVEDRRRLRKRRVA